MSFALLALQNSAAQELDRIRQQAEAISQQAAIGGLGLMPLLGTPSSIGVVEATNQILDPAGLLMQKPTWELMGSGKMAQQAQGPPGWASCVSLTSIGLAPGVRVTAATGSASGSTAWCYLLLNSPVPVNVWIGETGYPPVPGRPGWQMVRIVHELGVPVKEEPLTIELAPSWVAAGEVIKVTGVTVCFDGDPGIPFDGDVPDFQKHPEEAYAVTNYAYTWVGPRGASLSVAHGRSYDMLALAERQAQLDTAPFGQSIEQRRAYLQARYEARHRPWGATFVALLVDLIRQDSPSFGAENVRVREFYSNRSFWLEIDYSPTAVMAARVERLAKEIKPAHLALEGPSGPIVWGSFILARDHESEPEPEGVGHLSETPL